MSIFFESLATFGSRAMRSPRISQAVKRVLTQNTALHETTRRLSERFIAGEKVEDGLADAARYEKKGIRTTFDFLGEDVHTKHEAARIVDRYADLVTLFSHNNISKANLSVKPSAVGLAFDRQLALHNVLKIARTAECLPDSFVRLDMEGSDRTEATILLAEKAHARGANVGTVLQARLHRTPDDIERLNEQNIRVRLVKGAYAEPSAIAYQQAHEVDSAYVKNADTLLQHGKRPAFGTHDPRLVHNIQLLAREHKVSPRHFEFQTLKGIHSELPDLLVKEGYTARVYSPIGNDVLGYLIRRLAENPKNLELVLSNLIGSRFTSL